MYDHLILNQQSSTDDLQLLTIKGYFILEGVMSLKYIWEMKPLLPVVMMLLYSQVSMLQEEPIMTCYISNPVGNLK